MEELNEKQGFFNKMKSIFSLKADSASYEEIEEGIISGANLYGTNMCILILSIVIASIGLNMNSIATIIGAMLISPLMGPIIAIGYGIATNNIKLTKTALTNLSLQIVIALITSTIYFLISPIKTETSEILNRVYMGCFNCNFWWTCRYNWNNKKRKKQCNTWCIYCNSFDATNLYSRIWNSNRKY